ncbi:NADH:flavin oxidoreductase/NADH oxidase [Rhodocollybia butyracea]|uniref:NADH:flavin oxidoreductase/NADH oxidase n=1 Tax=Rhodocollybia butyracea TaxID=206335 RepID=A0A9P5PAM7_9AGAR|nr:NADH:flavin oxidoreductase/NADH oxidase [Rhodocollybia butyracea]
MSPSTSNLFAPIKVGKMSLNHRVVMAPMTRLRTTSTFSLLKVVKEYYSQRASTPGTFIISEGTVIGPDAAGFPGAPGIWSKEHIAAWKEVVDAVHARGSYIYLQIAAMGRVAQSAVLKSLDASYEVVGAGDIPLAGGEVPRPMTADEIKTSVALFAQAAADAVDKAGFDGVELHGANGFLIDQFLQDVTNNREDHYGGSIANRGRFALEVVDAVTRAIGEERTALRLSPWNKDSGMGMKTPLPTYTHLVSQLKERHPNLSYLHLIQSRDLDDAKQSNETLLDLWSPRPLVIADGFNREKAIKTTEREGVLVAFGRQFISNPDLPIRLQAGMPLSVYDRSTFYGGDENGKGYTDYAFAPRN